MDERCCVWSEGNREMLYVWMRGVVCEVSAGNREMLYVCMRGVVCGVRGTGRCYMCV